MNFNNRRLKMLTPDVSVENIKKLINDPSFFSRYFKFYCHFKAFFR